MTQVIESTPRRSSTEQIWLNPVNNQVYSTVFQPDHGFTSEVGAYKIYDPAVATHNRKVIEKASMDGSLNQNLVDGLKSPYHDSELAAAAQQYDTLLKNNAVKEAAML